MVAYTDDVMARLIVDDIVDDISDRRGLKSEWYAIDEDIQKEIKDTWKNIILQYIKRRK
jgi:geranylgeranyl pyrophosphate synthase